MVNIKNETIILNGAVYEDEVLTIRKALKELEPKPITIDLRKCDDIHTAVLQIIVSYALLYEVKYILNNSNTTYQKLLTGISQGENNCH